MSERKAEVLMTAAIIACSTSFVFSKMGLSTMGAFNILAAAVFAGIYTAVCPARQKDDGKAGPLHDFGRSPGGLPLFPGDELRDAGPQNGARRYGFSAGESGYHPCAAAGVGSVSHPAQGYGPAVRRYRRGGCGYAGPKGRGLPPGGGRMHRIAGGFFVRCGHHYH